MLVGVLVSIMISIVVGVSLVPTIVSSINTAKNTAGIPTGLSGLLDVLSYVFVAVRKNCRIVTSLIRGKLNSLSMLIPSQVDVSQACVETLQEVPLKGKEKVRTSQKCELSRILLGAVAWIGGPA